MRKFTDARAPLTMIKFKMQLKAEKVESYKVFQGELEKMCDEQNRFHASCELDVAKAESIDPVQVITFSMHSSEDVYCEKFCPGAFHMQLLGHKVWPHGWPIHLWIYIYTHTKYMYI